MFKKKFKGSYVRTLIMSAADAIDFSKELDGLKMRGWYSIETIDDGKATITILTKNKKECDKLMNKLSERWVPVVKDETDK